MSTKPESRTLKAVLLLSQAPELPLNQLVHWILARSSISRATAYRIAKRHKEPS